MVSWQMGVKLRKQVDTTAEGTEEEEEEEETDVNKT